MRYRHVIWDWNGTLLDDAWLCVEIMNGLLGPRGLAPLTMERYQEVFDFPVVEYYRRLGFDFQKESFEKLGTDFIVEYEKRRLECDLQPGAREALAAIERAGLTQSVLSAYRQDTLEELVDHFGLRRYFVALAGLEDHYAAGKTGNARKLIAGLPHAPREVLLIGDTVHDHEVARAIGANCVLVPCGHQSRAR
ncbi:MAG: HAD family hydrolase, partial [bacterium]